MRHNISMTLALLFGMSIIGLGQEKGPFKVFVRGDNDFSFYLSRRASWIIVNSPEHAQVDITFSRISTKPLIPTPSSSSGSWAKITAQDDRGNTKENFSEIRRINVEKGDTRITFDIKDSQFPFYGYGALFCEIARVADIRSYMKNMYKK
jgi:hypothetical protein